MAQGTLTVTATETTVNVVGFAPGEQVTFEIHYHYGSSAANYLSIGGYTNADDAGNLALTIPLGSDFVNAVSGSTFTFADGPFFTGNGVFLATRP